MGFINERQHILELASRVILDAKLVQQQAQLVTKKYNFFYYNKSIIFSYQRSKLLLKLYFKKFYMFF